MAAEDAGKKAQEHGMKTLEVEIQGPGSEGVSLESFISCRHDCNFH